MSESDSKPGRCPKCGADLDAGAFGGVCPACAYEGLFGAPKAGDGAVEAGGDGGVRVGDLIGPYKILEVIGEGGWGTVYVADQEQPVRRRVALKVIKLGMDTRQVIGRFELERQALAMMDHPNIAKVLDAGSTATGRPYFVMELVKGVRITDYCDGVNLPTEDRLKLFVQVCHAIQHAHQKGIIHRDVKPANILVTLHDNVPVAKVIDFGIAKAMTSQRLTDKTVYTGLRELMGTPAYMSPEQAELTGLDVDTRADIYALGVLLYELLTGRTPFDTKRLAEARAEEVRRIIREEEPPRPSTRISTLQADEQKTLARHRSAEVPRLLGIVRGDLDWIVMKALEKDRTRRYETVNGLAAEIQRYLGGEPISARPPSTAYRLRKAIRRNKLAVAAASLVAMALIVGLGLATLGWRQALAEREKALASAKAARESQAREATERLTAQQRLYESLVREARSLRLARRAGYREEAFALLVRARELGAARVELTELRREALACLGDFVGNEPMPPIHCPDGTGIRQIAIAPGDRIMAALLSDGTIQLSEVASGRAIARLTADPPATGLCFVESGEELLTLHPSPSSSPADRFEIATVSRWAADANRQWGRLRSQSVPGATQCLSTRKGPVLLIRDRAGNALELLDLNSNATLLRIANLFGMWADPVALSADAEWFAFAGGRSPGVLQLWHVSQGVLSRRIEVDLGEVSLVDLALSTDGKFLACLSQVLCSVYDAPRGKHLGTLHEYFYGDAGVSFAPNTTLLALPRIAQSRVSLWDGLKGETPAFLDLPWSPSRTVFSPGGTLVAAYESRGGCLFTMASGPEVTRLPRQSASVHGASVSPDGSRIATVCKDRGLRVWDAATGQRVWERALAGVGESVFYRPDGRFLATTTWGVQSVWLWDAATGERVLEIGETKPGFSWSARFSPDGRQLVAALSQDGLAVWSLQLPGLGQSSEAPSANLVSQLEGDVVEADFLPDGRQVVYVNWEGNGEARQMLWNFASDEPPRPLSGSPARGFQSQDLTRNRSRLVTLQADGMVAISDPATDRSVGSFPTEKREAASGIGGEANLAVSPDGSRIAVTTRWRRGVHVWSATSGRLLYALPEQNGTVEHLTWSPDSARVVVSRSDGEVEIWDLDKVEETLRRLGLGHASGEVDFQANLEQNRE